MSDPETRAKRQRRLSRKKKDKHRWHERREQREREDRRVGAMIGGSGSGTRALAFDPLA